MRALYDLDQKTIREGRINLNDKCPTPTLWPRLKRKPCCAGKENGHLQPWCLNGAWKFLPYCIGLVFSVPFIKTFCEGVRDVRVFRVQGETYLQASGVQVHGSLLPTALATSSQASWNLQRSEPLPQT